MRPRAPLPGLDPGPGSLLALSGPAPGQLRPTPSLASKGLSRRMAVGKKGREGKQEARARARGPREMPAP
eukprot:64626-Pyramimonas_sp.AAC.1